MADKIAKIKMAQKARVRHERKQKKKGRVKKGLKWFQKKSS